jgi:tyrosyl-tRNA synthetase
LSGERRSAILAGLVTPASASIERQVSVLMYGVDHGDPKLTAAMQAELVERLREGRPLRVYCGYDPTAPDIHLGHTLTLRKLRQFQDFGHEVIFLVGTFTGQLGDASDKAAGRPRRSAEQVQAAADSYAEQCFKILDRERTRVAYNGEWLAKLSLADVIELASHFTVQQFLARDNFHKRIETGNPIGLHEFMYALMQGYDAVQLRADVQLGATEQLFNIQAGRKLQQAFGQKPCICLTTPILVGTDGQQRMSKSTGNYVGVSESAEQQFGKTMSISDETMLQWMRYVSGWDPAAIEERARELRAGTLHPMELKKRLAHAIVAQFHGTAAAEAAAREFESVHQRGELPPDMPELRLAAPTPLLDVLCRIPGVPSRSVGRRLLRDGGVRLDGVTASDGQQLVARDCVLQVGKRRFARVIVEASSQAG